MAATNGKTAAPRGAERRATGIRAEQRQPVTGTGFGPAEPRVAQNETHIFNLSSPDGQYTIGFPGVAPFEVGDCVGFTHKSRYVGPQELSNGVNARRARIGFSGQAAGDWSYAFVYDAGGTQDAASRGCNRQIVTR